MKSEITEQWLSSLSVKWEYVEYYPVKDLPAIKPEHTQIRLDHTQQLNKERIEEMGIAYANGAKFPAVVVWRDAEKKKSFQWVDGHHRGTMFIEREVVTIDVYFVECDESQRTILQRTSNSAHGMPLSREEKLEHALYIMNANGLTAAEVSRFFSIPTHTLLSKKKAEEVKSSLKKIGFHEDFPSRGHWLALAPLHRLQYQLVLAEFAHKASLNAQDMVELARRINACNSDQEVAELMAEEQRKRADEKTDTLGGKIRTMSPLVKGTSFLAKARECLSKDFKPNAQTRPALKNSIAEIERIIGFLQERLAFLKGQYKKMVA